MRAVIAHREGEPRVVELEKPPVGRGTVVIRVSHSALLLPDELDMIRTIPSQLKKGQDGLPLGMMVSGIVDEVGEGVEELKAGLRVAAFGNPYVYHATHLSIPSKLVIELPKKVNHEEGAFVGQGARSLHMIRVAEVAIGENVLVFGGGMTGNLVAQVARAAGANPIVVDESDFRLAKARNVGITSAFPLDQNALLREVDKLTDGLGADTAIITADAPPHAVKWAAALLRFGGRMLLTREETEPLPAKALHEKEITVRTVSTASPGHGDRRYELEGLGYPHRYVRWTLRDNMLVFLNLLAERKVQISPLISERVPLDRAATLYEKVQRANQAVIGAILTT